MNIGKTLFGHYFFCVEPKPGRCPFTILIARSSHYSKTCNGKDSDCQGSQKCCDDGLGGKVCAEPMKYEGRICLAIGLINIM